MRLDKQWRKEINETTIIQEGNQQNSIVAEDSYLSKRVANYKATLKCIEYNNNASIVYQSLSENEFWLKNSRYVEKAPNNTTKITYKVEFDVAIVKHGLGFMLPVFIVKYYTQITMNKYLNKLKHILESTGSNL